MRHVALFSLILGLLVVASPEVAAKGKKGKGKPKVTIDEGSIYLGDPANFRKPAVVDVDKVYQKIPEYREILDRDLDDSDPRYLILMRAASDKFRAALDAVSEEKGYDLIGGLGSIQIEGKKVPEITALVIKKLPE